jgi:large-conductance mechanosensitive channel
MWPLNFLQSEINEFANFLDKKNVLTTSMGLILALQINTLFLNIIDDIIKPVASKVVDEDINKHTVDINGIKLKVGHLFFSIFNVFITLIMIFYLYRISTESSTIVSGIQDSFKKILNVFN